MFASNRPPSSRGLSVPPRTIFSRSAQRRSCSASTATLEALIRTGRLRTVDVGGGSRIPRAELERVLAASVEVPKEKRRRAPRAKRGTPSSEDPEELRKLDLSRL